MSTELGLDHIMVIVVVRDDASGFDPPTPTTVRPGGYGDHHPFDRRAKGVNDIEALFRDLWKGNDSFVHFAIQGVIEINGDAAAAQCVCHEQARGPNGRYSRTHGVWSDRLRRSDNGWVFTSRTYRYLWLDTSPFSGDVFSFLPDSP